MPTTRRHGVKVIGTTHYAGQSQRKTTCPQASRLRSVCPQRQPSTTKGCVGVQSRQKLDKNDCDRTRGIDCDDSPNAQSESKATLPRAGMDAWIYRRLPKPKARTAKEGARSSRPTFGFGLGSALALGSHRSPVLRPSNLILTRLNALSG